ncbi:hypothetical protein [Apilactobacillus timberlakei]|uniref:hypothetical protein n=1 Tax=Apilactobacillus timberlakei TaxID=2008380 RepID=UPI001128F84E|nr:hypothetical protein [Apilactobacillus timberlakei]TPR19102.1 hypothetical protein DYZ95_00360 [Apilactobacillus timberlakei]
MKTNWTAFWLGILVLILPGVIFILINNVFVNIKNFILFLIIAYYITIIIGSKLMSKRNSLINEFYEYFINNKNSLSYRKIIIILPMMFLPFLPMILLFFVNFDMNSLFLGLYMLLYCILFTFITTTKFNFEK